jgi:LuxR family maltose regulon positive regulatory protein
MLPVPAESTAVPAPPEPFVPRTRLLAELDDEGSQVGLVCAPAGFGKTALLACWARVAASTIPVVWADFGGGADQRVWPVILSALTGCPAVPRDSALHELGRSGLSSTPAFGD